MSINESLQKYDFLSTLSKVVSLLTLPYLQANSHRIENLIYLVIANCKKTNLSPTNIEIENWLNKHIERNQEDPIEDVFVTNIITPLGNHRIFEGLWHSNDFFLQKTIDSLYSKDGEYKEILMHIFNLLKLSDAIVERAGLSRWDYSKDTCPQNDIKLPSQSEIQSYSNRVIFTMKELNSLGIYPQLLAPFSFTKKDAPTLTKENYGCSELEKKPLIYFGDKFVVALPNAISSAIRYYVISEFQKNNSINKLEQMFFKYECHLVETPIISPLYDLLSQKIQHNITHSVPYLKDWLVKHDMDKYLHVILYHEPINKVKNDTEQQISLYIDKVSEFCQSQSDFKEGNTLLILGSDGLQPVGKKIKFKNTTTWQTSYISTDNFLKLSALFDQRKWSLKNYLKFLSQKKWLKEKGMKFYSIDGDYNLYNFWYHQGCTLIPKNISLNSYSLMLSDIVFSLNKKIRKLLDNHVIKDVNGQYIPVTRYNISSFVSSIKKLPIYISLHHLFIVIENKDKSPKWLKFKCNPEFMKTCSTLLHSGLDTLYQRTVLEVENLYKKKATEVLEICLNFEDVDLKNDTLNKEHSIDPISIYFDFTKYTATIKFPKNFFYHFMTPESSGEREIIKSIIISLVSLYEKKETTINKALDILVNKIVKKETRIFHIFKPDHLYGFIQGKTIDFKQTYADEIFSRIKILQQFSKEKPGAILIKKKAQKFLNSLYHRITLHIISKLKLFDKAILIRQLMDIHESILYENNHWDRTVGAVIALYKDGKEIAEEEKRNRDAIKQSCQILLEMAICTCPENDGKKASNWDIDELLAEMLFLLEVAIDSDVLYHNLCHPPQIKIENNGEYTIDKSFLHTIMRSFIRDSEFQRFQKKTQEYNTFYEKENKNNPFRDKVKIINEPFLREFGISINNLNKVCSILFEMAIKKKALVVETTVREIKEKCKSAGLSEQVASSFIDSFSIFHRPEWKTSPDGFVEKDIFPSKYNRRLSFNVRPLLIFNKSENSKVFYGIGHLFIAIPYLLSQIYEGNFHPEFFKSKEMQHFHGETNNKKANEFNQRVADEFKKLNWNVELNVNMSQLHAPEKFGDIDVLAWKGNQVKIIESKRLQPARNINEVINSLKRFKGENNDLLQKHINRFKWIQQNIDSISQIIGFTSKVDCISAHIVTNILIPSQYIQSIPVDSQFIIQIENLKEIIK